ncbi:LCP family protein [Puerhibacterium puerhi]|uniref:LCP family protein n=1 Tax=Puerhibacterium puerhi TaxID=2692623 RepID=UPI001356D1FD|nr:LCP family protein [Puerhibacterium puerhi]
MPRTRTVRSLAGGLAALLVLVLAACTTQAPRPATTVTASGSAATKQTPPSPSPTAPADPLPEGAVNALFLGTDSRTPGSMTGNADVIMLVHVPADRRSVYLLSFTRDMWVPIPGLGEGKINSAFSRGGTQTMVDTLSGLLGGVEVDYVLQADFNGFIAVTRALGGFEVDNKHHSTVTVQSTGRVVDFPEGRITLSGTDGLIYVRERKRLPLGDLDRTERQRAAVVGILDKIKQQAQDPAALAELIPMLAQNVKITGDLQLEDLFALVPMAQNLTRDDVVSLMVPITGFGTKGGASVNLVDAPQVAALGEALRADTMEQYVAQYGTGYAP